MRLCFIYTLNPYNPLIKVSSLPTSTIHSASFHSAAAIHTARAHSALELHVTTLLLHVSCIT
jgi:hypothetical protein